LSHLELELIQSFHNKGIFPNRATAQKLEVLKDLTLEQRRVRGRLWADIKMKKGN
jgi:hypothetical protein